MKKLMVVKNPSNWPLRVPGVAVVSAQSYLTEAPYNESGNFIVFNLCRSYRYQSNGYYVSLLAEARGHKAVPSVLALQDMRSAAIIRVMSADLEDIIGRALGPLTGDRFVLSIYFGRNMAKRYATLARRLFELFHAPLLRAHFVKQKDRWQLQQISPIAMNDVPDSHREFLLEAATAHLARSRKSRSRIKRTRYDIAILHDPTDPDPPSDERALSRFSRAALDAGLAPELITKDDYDKLAEFDALFIRATTMVNHYTYRFSRRAATNGLVVIDDPESIIRCTNKVYLAELLTRQRVPTPRTVIVHRDRTDDVLKELPFPIVLKAPDSAFSIGVKKAKDPEELESVLGAMFKDSDLILAQEFVPTDFDWRVGVINGKPLYACRYHMARHHWQIIRRDKRGRSVAGAVDTVPIEAAPQRIIRTAVRAASLIGKGLYGVDLKESGKRVLVIEINDNPSIEAGFEDRVLGRELYSRIMESFVRRIERMKER